jgi:hypothetical protein
MEVSLAELFVIILVFAFAGAGVSVFMDRRRDRVSARAIKRSTIRCRVCGCVYSEPLENRSGLCPECGRENLRGRDRRLG